MVSHIIKVVNSIYSILFLAAMQFYSEPVLEAVLEAERGSTKLEEEEQVVGGVAQKFTAEDSAHRARPMVKEQQAAEHESAISHQVCCIVLTLFFLVPPDTSADGGWRGHQTGVRAAAASGGGP